MTCVCRNVVRAGDANDDIDDDDIDDDDDDGADNSYCMCCSPMCRISFKCRNKDATSKKSGG